MDISLVRREVVSQRIEEHFKIKINKKLVWVSRYNEYGEHISSELEIEIFKGKDLLTEDEIEEVAAFVEEQD